MFQYRTQKSREKLLGGLSSQTGGPFFLLWESSSTWDYCAILKRGVALLRLDVRMHGSTWSSPATERRFFRPDAMHIWWPKNKPDQMSSDYSGFIGIRHEPIRSSWNVKEQVVLPLLKWCVSVCFCRTQIGWCIELSRYRSIDVSTDRRCLFRRHWHETGSNSWS